MALVANIDLTPLKSNSQASDERERGQAGDTLPLHWLPLPGSGGNLTISADIDSHFEPTSSLGLTDVSTSYKILNSINIIMNINFSIMPSENSLFGSSRLNISLGLFSSVATELFG